jgi:hypothetical protein
MAGDEIGRAGGCRQGQEATARYALLTWNGEWRAESRLVYYDVEAVITRLLTAERPYRVRIVEMLRRAAHVPLATLE